MPYKLLYNNNQYKTIQNNDQYNFQNINDLFTLTLAGTTNQTITLKYTEPGKSMVTKTSMASN